MSGRVPKRYWLVLCTFLFAVLLYVDRSCISAAKQPILDTFHLTDKQFGWIGAMFALGYALCQVPSGALADRFGPRALLTAVVTMWSAFITGAALSWNYACLMVFRFLSGCGEAGAFPGIARASFSWIPMKERGLVNGINFSGSRLGAALALPVVATLIKHFGWRQTFGLQAAVGFAAAVLWYWWFRNDPSQHRHISEAELKHIAENRQKVTPEQEKEKLAGPVLLGSSNVGFAMGQYFCSNFTFYFCLVWAFSYLKETYNLDVQKTGVLAALPFIGGAAGNWLAGWLVDHIYRRGYWVPSRRLPAMLGFLLSAGGLVGFVCMKNPYAAVGFLTLAIFGADMTIAPSWSTCIDIGRKHAGAVSGIMNMAGNVGSFITSLAYPYLKAWTGSAKPYFLIAAGLNLLGILLWYLIRPDKTLKEY